MKKILPILLLLAQNLSAQVVAGNSFFDQIVSDWHMGYTFDVSGSASLSSDIAKGGTGTLGIYETNSELKFQGANKLHAIDLAVGYKYSHFDFSDIETISNTNQIYTNIFYNFNIDDNWSAFTMGRLNFSAQTTADLSDGIYAMIGAGFGYKFSQNFSIGTGVMAISRLDRDWIAIPIVYVNWKIDEHLTLRAFNGIAIIYDVFADGKLLISSAFEYKCTYYRLEGDGSGENISLENSAFEFTIAATYNITKNLYMSTSLGATAWRKLKIRVDGNKINQMDIDASPQIYFHIGCKF